MYGVTAIQYNLHIINCVPTVGPDQILLQPSLLCPGPAAVGEAGGRVPDPGVHRQRPVGDDQRGPVGQHGDTLQPMGPGGGGTTHQDLDGQH